MNFCQLNTSQKRVRSVLKKTGHSWGEARELADELKLPQGSHHFTERHCAMFRDLAYADWAAAQGLGLTYPLRRELWLVIAENDLSWKKNDETIWRFWTTFLELKNDRNNHLG